MKNALFAFVLALGTAYPVSALAEGAAQTVNQIDADCLAIQNATMALRPIHLALIAGKWKVLSEGDYAVAERTRASITFADVWKQGDNYAWVQSHSFDASGNQRATQLCFRQSDGTLERARQAATVPDVDGASAQVAYYASDGTLIQKSALFAVNDPAIAKKVSELSFYSVLP